MFNDNEAVTVIKFCKKKTKKKTCSLSEVKAADLMSDSGELHKFSVYSLSGGQKLGSVLIYFVFSFCISCLLPSGSIDEINTSIHSNGRKTPNPSPSFQKASKPGMATACSHLCKMLCIFFLKINVKHLSSDGLLLGCITASTENVTVCRLCQQTNVLANYTTTNAFSATEGQR